MATFLGLSFCVCGEFWVTAEPFGENCDMAIIDIPLFRLFARDALFVNCSVLSVCIVAAVPKSAQVWAFPAHSLHGPKTLHVTFT